MSQKQMIGTILSAQFVGRRVRFPDMPGEGGRVHTVRHVNFDSDFFGAPVLQLVTTHEADRDGCADSIVECDLESTIEYVDTATGP